jgi:DNA polymerase delta subunit 1
MKRNSPVTAGGASAGSGGGVGKKYRQEDEPSFEEELMMMDDMTDDATPEDEGEQELRWARPPFGGDWNPSEHPLQFQWLDIDMTSGEPLRVNPDGGKIVGSEVGPVPIIRLYGVTREGQSAMVAVHGFTPYFFVSVPSTTDLSPQALGQLRTYLDQRVNKIYVVH